MITRCLHSILLRMLLYVRRQVKVCVAFISLTVVRKMGAVLRSDNFVKSQNCAACNRKIFRLGVVVLISNVWYVSSHVHDVGALSLHRHAVCDEDKYGVVRL